MTDHNEADFIYSRPHYLLTIYIIFDCSHHNCCIIPPASLVRGYFFRLRIHGQFNPKCQNPVWLLGSRILPLVLTRATSSRLLFSNLIPSPRSSFAARISGGYISYICAAVKLTTYALENNLVGILQSGLTCAGYGGVLLVRTYHFGMQTIQMGKRARENASSNKVSAPLALASLNSPGIWWLVCQTIRTGHSKHGSLYPPHRVDAMLGC